MFWLRIALAALVSLFWAVGYALAYTGHLRNTPTELSGLMVIVLGWALGVSAKEMYAKRRNGGDGPDASKD